MSEHHRIDPTPEGAALSLTQFVAAVVETRSGGAGRVELLGASGGLLGTTTEACASQLWPSMWPPKLHDHGGPEHIGMSGELDAALKAGDLEAIAKAFDALKSVRPQRS